MTARRVYTGPQPVVFMTGNVGPVEHGQEFSVPDEHVAAFDARADVTDTAGGTPDDGGQDNGAGRGRRRRGQNADSSGEGDPAPPDGSEA